MTWLQLPIAVWLLRLPLHIFVLNIIYQKMNSNIPKALLLLVTVLNPLKILLLWAMTHFFWNSVLDALKSSKLWKVWNHILTRYEFTASIACILFISQSFIILYNLEPAIFEPIKIIWNLLMEYMSFDHSRFLTIVDDISYK